MSAPKEGTKYTPGDVVVLRGLRTNPHQPNSQLISPRVGLVVRLMPHGRAYVRLWQGNTFRQGTKFSKIGRVVERANISRLATERERVVGMPIGLETTRAA